VATLAITGALRTTPTDLLDAHAGLLPMELVLSKACHRAAVRILTLPNTHPLYRITSTARRRPPRKHLAPLDHTLATRELSIEKEDQDPADYKVFSDGSGLDEGIGAAAVIYRRGISQPIGHLKAYLGPPTMHNTYEVEVVGGILATWLTQITPGTDFKAVSLYIDNQSTIQASTNPKATSGQHLVLAFIQAADNTKAKLMIRWISSHSDIKGNEHTDKLGKEAAEGKTSPHEQLPPTLGEALPASASATKQEHLAHLKRKWKATWRKSPRHRRFTQIDNTFPFSKFREQQNELTRRQASLLIQVRNGHFPLNSYLHRIGKSEMKHCRKCRAEPGEETPVKTVNHFIFECDAYSQERISLTRATGRDNLNLKDIMLKTKTMKALTKFIHRTGRLNTDEQPAIGR